MRTGLIFSIVFASMAVHAQTMVVTKVKGNQAVVQLRPGSGTVQVGQTITNETGGDDGATLSGSTSAGDVSRGRLVGLEGIFSSVKSSSSAGGVTTTSSTNLLDLIGRYGWNKQLTEYGALGHLRMEDDGAGNIMTYGVGGFFDYNFQKNRPGAGMVYSVGIQGIYSMITLPNGGGSKTDIDLLPMGSLKWFLLGTSTALRIDLGYDYEQISFSGNKTSNTGLKAQAGFAVYF